MKSDAESLKGYLVSVPIPWDPGERLLADKLRRAIAKLLGEGCDGVYLFGTSGEGYAVTDAEFREIVEIFAEETREAGVFRQVGCFGFSAGQVKERLAMVQAAGVEGAQITLPCWKELTDAELLRYFADVCGAFPDTTFLFYNNPRDKRRLTGKELARAASVAPNLLGAKTGSGTGLDFYEIIAESPMIRHFVTEAAFLFCRPLGAAGLIPSSNYASPPTSRAYYEAVMAGDEAEAARLHRHIVAFFAKTAWPLFAKSGYIDGAIDKAYAKIGGMDIPLTMKSPYQRMSDADFAWLEQVCREHFASIGGT